MSNPSQLDREEVDLRAKITLLEERSNTAEICLELAAELGGVGVFVWDVRSKKIVWSEQHYRLHGYEPGEFEPTYEEFSRRIHPDDLRDLERAIELARETGSDFRASYQVEWPDRTTHVIESRGRFTYDDLGEPIHLLGVIRPLSTRATDHDFRRVGLDAPEAGRVGIWEFDIRTRRTSVSAEFLRIHGMSDRSYSIEEFFDLVPATSRQSVDDEFLAVVESGREVDIEHPICREDNGQLRWVHARGRVIRDSSDEVIGLVGTVQDVTERHNAEEALRASEELFSLLAKASPDIVFRADENGHATFVNDDRWTELTGLEAGSWAGEGWSAPIHPEDQQASLDSWKSTVEQLGPWDHEFRWVHRDGTVSSMLARALPTISDAGKLTGYVGTATDITQLRASESERRALQHALEQAQRLEAIGTLASGVAHDFNNQLAAIQGFVDLALADLPAGSRSKEHLENVKQATEQARGVTDGLLTFARKRDPERRPLRLDQLVAEGFDLFRKLVPAAITMTNELPEGPVWIDGDPAQIRQALANLIVNARDALPRGGRIRLQLTKERDDSAWTAVLRVTDNGTGMSKDVVSRAFEPFFTTKAPGRGTGLGLAVIHGILARHDGSVSIDSAVGRGTTIELRFPMVAVPPTEEAPEDPAPQPDPSKQILFVEDNELVRRMLVSVAQNAGYRVIEASNGTSATNLVAGLEESIDLAVLDVDLPGLDGVTCAEKLRERYADLSVIYLTGNPNSEALTRALPSDPIHAKPLAVRDLLKVISSALASD